MVDYVRLLARAVAALDPDAVEQRNILYARARRAVGEKLRNSAPPLSQAEIRAETTALEIAIRRVETDALSRPTSSQPKSVDETYDARIEAYRDISPLKNVRRQRRIIVGTVGALAIVLVGVGAYSFWPRMVPGVHNFLKARSVDRSARQPVADTSYIYMRQLVYYRTNYPEGTVIVDKQQAFIYVVRPRLAALRYSIGVGARCSTLAGLYHVLQKEEWPDWHGLTQPSADAMDGRMKSPLGARALDLTNDYRIHGTNAFPSSDQKRSRRCIGLVNDDVIDLYDRTPIGSRVVVLN